MVWILLLSGTDLSTHALTPWLGLRAFGVCLVPFGEYELSPSLIGLSLLHTVHPEAFQRLLVRAFIPCYRDFTLTMCRSLGFASAAGD